LLIDDEKKLDDC
jgi:hypothetical protein